MPLLFEGEAYADFRDEGGAANLRNLTRFIEMQEDIVTEYMENEFRPSSARGG